MKRRIITAMLATGLSSSAMGADIVHQSFGKIEFETTRLNTNESDYTRIPLELANTYGSNSYETLALDRQVAELVRLRVSQLDRCDYCVVFHTQDALEAGVPQVKVSSLPTWRQSGLFSEKERAALAYAEALSSLDNDAIQGAFDGLDEAGFSNVEKEELTMTTILMNVWSRMFLAQGKTSVVGTE